MNRLQTVSTIIWLDQLAAHAKAAASDLRGQLVNDAREEVEANGTAPTWRIPDVATVAASVSHQSVHVADEAALTRWMASRYPTEVETVQRIRAAWLPTFLGRLEVEHNTIEADRIAVDPGTGEWPPGLVVRAGGEFAGLSIRPSAAAKELFGAVAAEQLGRLTAGYETLAVSGADT